MASQEDGVCKNTFLLNEPRRLSKNGETEMIPDECSFQETDSFVMERDFEEKPVKIESDQVQALPNLIHGVEDSPPLPMTFLLALQVSTQLNNFVSKKSN